MYEGALPTTGIGISVGGTALGLSWLIIVGLAVIAAGVLATRMTRTRNVGG